MDRKSDFLNSKAHAKGPFGGLLAFAWVAFLGSLIYTLASISSYAFSAGRSFAFFRIPRISPVFADLRQLTHSSGCDVSFLELLANRSSCDPFQRSFNYTWPSLELLRGLGIRAADTEVLGALIGVFGVIAASVFVFSLVKSRVKALVVLTVFILSFPFQLAIERGNHDIIVFGACLFVPLLVFPPKGLRGRAIKAMTASVLAFGAVALKVFPLLGLGPWSFGLAIQWSERRTTWIPVLILTLSCLGILIQITDLPQIMANTPKPDGLISFGLLASYQAKYGEGIGMFLTALKASIVALVTYAMSTSKFNDLFMAGQVDRRLESSRQAAFMFSCMILIAWMVGRSWDYRLIIFLGVVPYFANIFDNVSPALKSEKLLICLGTSVVLFEPYVGGRIGFVSDVIIQPVLIGFLLAFLLRNRKTLLASEAGLFEEQPD